VENYETLSRKGRGGNTAKLKKNSTRKSKLRSEDKNSGESREKSNGIPLDRASEKVSQES